VTASRCRPPRFSDHLRVIARWWLFEHPLSARGAGCAASSGPCGHARRQDRAAATMATDLTGLPRFSGTKGIEGGRVEVEMAHGFEQAVPGARFVPTSEELRDRHVGGARHLDDIGGLPCLDHDPGPRSPRPGHRESRRWQEVRSRRRRAEASGWSAGAETSGVDSRALFAISRSRLVSGVASPASDRAAMSSSNSWGRMAERELVGPENGRVLSTSEPSARRTRIRSAERSTRTSSAATASRRSPAKAASISTVSACSSFRCSSTYSTPRAASGSSSPTVASGPSASSAVRGSPRADPRNQRGSHRRASDSPRCPLAGDDGHRLGRRG